MVGDAGALAAGAKVAAVLARERCNAVAGLRHGLRIGERQLMPYGELPEPVRGWIASLPGQECLLSAHHFTAAQWAATLADPAFPERFDASGGRRYADFVKILLVNSFEPLLQFVRPYRPTEALATSMMRKAADVDASVYDPNLEPAEAIAAFPDAPLRLYGVLPAERFDVVVHTVFSVDSDLRLLAETKRHSDSSLFIIGGPHLRTADLHAYFRALPIDGAILGDGQAPLLSLAAVCRQRRSAEGVAGIVTRRSLQAGRAGGMRASRPTIAGNQPAPGTMSLPSIWGLRSYADLAGILSGDGRALLPYDMIGLRPFRVLASQRCGKTCYWCRSPKSIPPRDPVEVVADMVGQAAVCDSFHFDDNEIWFAPDNFRRIGELLIDSGLAAKPALVKTTTDQITADRARFMHDMGVRIVAFGVEAFTQQSLDLLRKGTTVEQNHQALRLTLELGIKPGINAIWLVPGIDLVKTRQLILSVMPYLKQGAYLNLVPQLEMGDIRSNRQIRLLTDRAYFHDEPRRFPGDGEPLSYLVLSLPTVMEQFRQVVAARMEQSVEARHRESGGRNMSVALWSLCLLGSIISEFPPGSVLTRAEREQALHDLERVELAVGNAEREHLLRYDALD